MESSFIEDVRSVGPASEEEEKHGPYIVEPDEAELDIRCSRNIKYATKDIPKKYKELYGEVESASNVIKSLKYTDRDVKIKYFKKLGSLAKVGLEGEIEQTELALIALAKLKEEMVMVEGQRIKNGYMKRLGLWAAGIAAVLLAAYFALSHFYVLEFLLPYIIAVTGAMAGTWVSFGARRLKISFGQLSVIEEDMMSPPLRLAYIGLCSVIFLLLLGSNAVSVSVGGASTADIAENIPMQAIVGIICGLVESSIGVTIYKKAKAAVSEEKS